ncbi:Abi family protein [Aerolutibacter ruishenii]|uniref:Abortive infection bacteriophage resistance protein n=1 Tax=Aerolutibacter ruishenii TaxID=686800 RepID=A0A562LI56_9GAMM|nr:Abi family protein [Lysobacter ruishenii]TWI07287.1 abortive infection bacteriophage resistance protein [Lysobacter ruishenii]
MKFAKPPISFDDMVRRWRDRGMVIDDPAGAAQYLAHINYYRFAGYVLPFEEDHATHGLKSGTRFEDVLNLYVFDRELRLLMLDAIERIEVSLRTQWAYHLAHATGPHGYLDIRNAASARNFASQLALLERELDRSREAFISHHRSKYTDPDLPPVWVACEVMSLGQLSQWYTLLRPLSLRKKIAATYGLDQQVLQSVLLHLSYVRNLCAHHSRLWNREMVITFSVPKRPSALRASIADPSSRQIYNSCCVIAWLMQQVNPGNHWRSRLADLLCRHHVDMAAMGFPKGWQSQPLWAPSTPV